MSMPIRNATGDGKHTLCGLYGGFHSPKIMVKPVEGWAVRVTCKRCRKSPIFKRETEQAK